MNFILTKECKANAYTAIPKKMVKLDLDKAYASKLATIGYEEVCNARVMLIVKKDNIEITIHPDGRLLIKTKSEEVASRITADMYSALFMD